MLTLLAIDNLVNLEWLVGVNFQVSAAIGIHSNHGIGSHTVKLLAVVGK